MPTFNTPEPISVTLELGIAHVRIVAADRPDTVVEVRPSDPAKKSDVSAAEHTRVEYADGKLSVKAPRGWKLHSFRSGGESIDVQIDVPAGSHLRGDSGIGTLRASGLLGECSFGIGAGDIEIDRAERVHLKTGVGHVTVGRTGGHTVVTTGTGGVRIDGVDGTAVVKNSNGDTWIGEVTGDLRVASANGSIAVDRSPGTVAAKTARGDIRLGEVARGDVRAETAYGQVEVGIRQGVAAWLDLDTRFGKVHNDLDAADSPAPGEDTVEIRARTSFGDITIRRARARDVSRAEA
jgi:DUF4097 and DUF4098 domain-containing protein YvlB